METQSFRGMEYRRMGNSGLWTSAVGLGLWKWGDPSYDGSRVGEHEGFKILDRALELGVTHWDTANSYNLGSGNSERLLGRFFNRRGSQARNMVVLATKVKHPVRNEHQLHQDFSPNESGASRKYLLQAVEDSLDRLQTDRIDVLYHHAPSLSTDGTWQTPLDETWEALERLVKQGKVLYLAVSNRNIRQLAEEQAALAAVTSCPAYRIIGVQNWYNILQRPKVSTKDAAPTLADEQEFLNYLAEKRIGLVPCMPLAVGLLTGRYGKGQLDSAGRLSMQSDEGLRRKLLTERNLNLVEKLEAITRGKGCTLPQLAIAWLLSHDVVCSVIAGVTKISQLDDNARACSVSVTRQELEMIDQLTK